MRPPETLPPLKTSHPSGKPVPAPSGDTLSGFVFAMTAYLLWSFLPFFMKALEHISPVEVVANRAVWSVPVAALLLVVLGRTGDILPTLKNPKKLGILFFSALIISINWGTYVLAITTDRVVEAALGYYINPLITVALGALFLGERLNRLQMLSVALAFIGVFYLTVSNGQLPWISLVLALSFGFYGLVRKTADIGPTQGFFIEVLLMSLLALPYLVWLAATGQGHFGANTHDTVLLLLCGPVTAIPLICFAFGAKGLRMSTIGITQYIVPSLVVLIGVFVFGEPFGSDRLIAFSFIWVALAIFTFSMLQREKSKAA